METTAGCSNIPNALLPTPKASDGRPKGNGGYRKSPGLDQMARKGMLPMPNTTDYKGPNTRSQGKERPICDDDLPTRVQRMLPTPSARDWKSGKASQETHERNSRPLNEVMSNGTGTGRLSPCFVEWMMGFPEGWTELSD